MAPTREYASLLSEAQLAFNAAALRLGKARHALIQHGSVELTRERELLEIEVDEAERFFRKCARDLQEAKGKN
jgi:hypothetical protein